MSQSQYYIHRRSVSLPRNCILRVRKRCTLNPRSRQPITRGRRTYSFINTATEDILFVVSISKITVDSIVYQILHNTQFCL